MQKKLFTIGLGLLLLCNGKIASAQDNDWQKMLADAEPKKKENVLATFKTTRIINAQSNETVKKRTLDFRVSHRFGPIGGSAGTSHTLYGFDVSSDIRIAFEYGLSDKVTLGFARSKAHENLQGLIKWRVFEQTTDNKMPFAFTFYADGALSPVYYTNWQHRYNYCMEFIFARKFSPGFSLQLMPTWIHRNYCPDPYDENDLISLGAGGRIKLSKRFAFIFDYYYTFNNYRNTDSSGYYLPLGLGVEIETGGHVFSVMFTNSAGIIESEYIPYTTDAWKKGGIRFAFNISRGFRL